MFGVPRFKIFPAASISPFLVFSFSYLCCFSYFYMLSVRLFFFFLVELVLGLIMMPMMNKWSFLISNEENERYLNVKHNGLTTLL